MKNTLLFSLIALFILAGCGKDEEPKTIDRYIGTYTGTLTDYDCTTSVVTKTYNDVQLKTSKVTEVKFDASILDNTGSELLNFRGELPSESSDTFYVSEFLLNNVIHIANGFYQNGKINIIFGNENCKGSNGDYKVIKEFNQK